MDVIFPEMRKGWMETSLQKRLKIRMDMKGLNAYQTALQAGLGGSFVRDILRGKTRSPSAENLEKLARALDTTVDWFTAELAEADSTSSPSTFEIDGLLVQGSIQAGHWVDRSIVDEYDEREVIPVARDPRFPRARQYGLQVIGDSMDIDYPDGSYVSCVDFNDSGLGIRPELVVHVERRNGHLVEATLKVIEMIDGKLMLSPRSTNKRHVPLSLDGDAGTEIVICGIVTGSYRRTKI